MRSWIEHACYLDVVRVLLIELLQCFDLEAPIWLCDSELLAKWTSSSGWSSSPVRGWPEIVWSTSSASCSSICQRSFRFSQAVCNLFATIFSKTIPSCDHRMTRSYRLSIVLPHIEIANFCKPSHRLALLDRCCVSEIRNPHSGSFLFLTKEPAIWTLNVTPSFRPLDSSSCAPTHL